MRKDISPPVIVAILAVVVVVSLMVGWFLINRNAGPVPYKPASTPGGGKDSSTGGVRSLSTQPMPHAMTVGKPLNPNQ
jgi:hypothetical protein